jgi:hypothetical protein
VPQRHPTRALGRRPYTLRGLSHAFSRGSPWEEDESWQHADLSSHGCAVPAQCRGWLYSDKVRPHSDGFRAPGDVSGARVGGDLLFDYGACGRSAHLVPLSGRMSGAPSVEGWPQMRQRFARGALIPRARQRWARGWLGFSSDAEIWRVGECPRRVGSCGCWAW